MRIDAGGGEVAAAATAQQPVVDQCRGDIRRSPAQHFGVGHRQFCCRAEQLRAENIRVRRVDDHHLDRLFQQCLRMMNKVGVQRIVAGDQHDQRALSPPSGPARLLPERRDAARKPGQHHRIEPGDVHTEFQSIGGGQPHQLTAGQRALECPAILGEVSGAVRRHPIRDFWRRVGEPRPRTQRGQLRAPPRPHERQRPRPFGHQVGHHARRLSARGAAHRRSVLAGHVGAQRGFPQRDGPRTVGRLVVGHFFDCLPDQL